MVFLLASFQTTKKGGTVQNRHPEATVTITWCEMDYGVLQGTLWAFPGQHDSWPVTPRCVTKVALDCFPMQDVKVRAGSVPLGDLNGRAPVRGGHKTELRLIACNARGVLRMASGG